MMLQEIEKYKELPTLAPVEHHHHHQEQVFNPSHEPQQSYRGYGMPQTPVHQKFGAHGFPS